MSLARRFSLVSSLFALRTSETRCSSVPQSLRKEELPSFLVCAKLVLEGSTQLCRLPLFIRVYRRSLICALLERLESNWLHPPKVNECPSPFDVYDAPNTAGLLLVNRIVYLASSTLFRTASIQPKQSASSTDSGQLILGLPELLL